MASSKASPTKRRKVESIRRINLKASDNPYQHWSVKEKRAILKGLKEYGGSDLNKLASVVETKSVEEINRFIEGRKRRCSVSSTLTRAPIELWLDKAQRNISHQCDYSKGLAEVVSNCIQNGYDDVYQFIIHLLKCESPPQLSNASGSVLRALLHDLVTLIKSLDMDTLLKNIKEYQNSDSSSSTPGHDDELDLHNNDIFRFYNEGATGTMDKEDMNSFNPLKMPPSFLRNIFLSARENMRDLIDSGVQ